MTNFQMSQMGVQIACLMDPENDSDSQKVSDEDSHEKQLLKSIMPPIHIPQHACETDFPYELLSQIYLPEEIRINFIQLAWKTRCNVSNNMYNQLIDIRDSNFLKLMACRKVLF